MTNLIWMIDKDHINEEDHYSRAGWGQYLANVKKTQESLQTFRRSISMAINVSPFEIENNNRVRWRAFDDDGILYYEGYCTIESIMGDDDWSYAITEFVETDAGASHIFFNIDDIAKCGFPQFAASHPRSNLKWILNAKQNWIEIYV